MTNAQIANRLKVARRRQAAIVRKVKNYKENLEAKLEKAESVIVELRTDVTTLEGQAVQARDKLIEHGQRISTLEGYHT